MTDSLNNLGWAIIAIYLFVVAGIGIAAGFFASKTREAAKRDIIFWRATRSPGQ
jgi:hypothetical protein